MGLSEGLCAPERNLGEPSWWLSWREEGFTYLCRS